MIAMKKQKISSDLLKLNHISGKQQLQCLAEVFI